MGKMSKDESTITYDIFWKAAENWGTLMQERGFEVPENVWDCHEHFEVSDIARWLNEHESNIPQADRLVVLPKDVAAIYKLLASPHYSALYAAYEIRKAHVRNEN